MEYSKEYHNQKWLYTVWHARDGSDHILMAIHPGVGWEDVAMKLTPDEIRILKRSEDEFTDFVKRIVAERNIPIIRQRRIESRIRMAGLDEMIVDE